MISESSALPTAGVEHLVVQHLQEVEDIVQNLISRKEEFAVSCRSFTLVLWALRNKASIADDSGEILYHGLSVTSSPAEVVSRNKAAISVIMKAIPSPRISQWDLDLAVKEIQKREVFFDQITLLDIIKSEAKDKSIYDLVSGELISRENHFENRVKRMIFPAQAELIDNSEFEPRSCVINASEMGSSKTESAMRLFEKSIEIGSLPLLIIPNIALASQFESRDEHYKNLVTEDGRPILKKGAITTINSARISAHSQIVNQGQVKIFDEAIKLFEHVSGMAFFDGSLAAQKSGFKFIFDQMRHAKDVLISDAHFGQSYIDVIEKVSGRKFKAVESKRGRYENIKVHHGNLSVDDLVAKAKSLLDKGESFGFFSDRKAIQANAIYKELAEYAKKCGLKSILINKTEIDNLDGEARKSVQNPDQDLKGKAVVFFSPAIGPGFSARISEVKTILMDCCGTISPLSLIQTSMRFRCVEHIYMSFHLKPNYFELPETKVLVCQRVVEEMLSLEGFYNHAINKQEKDISKKASEIRINNSGDDQEVIDRKIAVMQREIRSIEVDPAEYQRSVCQELLSDADMCAAFEIKALENWSRNRYKKFTITAMHQLGFLVEVIDSCANSSSVERSNRVQRIRAERDIRKEIFLSDTTLDQVYEKAQKQNALIENEEYYVEKYNAGKMMGIEEGFSEEDFSFVSKKGLSVISNIGLLNLKKTKATNDQLNKSTILRDVYRFVNDTHLTKDGFNIEGYQTFLRGLKAEKLTYNGKKTTKFTLVKHYFSLYFVSSDLSKSIKDLVRLLGYDLRVNQNSKKGKGADRKNVINLDSSFYEKAVIYKAKGESLLSRKPTIDRIVSEAKLIERAEAVVDRMFSDATNVWRKDASERVAKRLEADAASLRIAAEIKFLSKMKFKADVRADALYQLIKLHPRIQVAVNEGFEEVLYPAISDTLKVVSEFFDGDVAKSAQWLTHPMFGREETPIDLIAPVLTASGGLKISWVKRTKEGCEQVSNLIGKLTYGSLV